MVTVGYERRYPYNTKKRRSYTDELKAEAVQMMLDGHPAASVAAKLGSAV